MRSQSENRGLPAVGLALCLFCLGLAPLCAQEAGELPFRGEFWAEFHAVPAHGEENWPPDSATVKGRLLSEAAYVFGGMSGGFDFEWVPPDSARGIAERFVLKPRLVLDARDPRILPEAPRYSGTDLFAYVSYMPDENEKLDIAAYRLDPWRSANGVGLADFINGYPGRRMAYEDAARDAVRSLLQSLSVNKPRRVRGRIVFSAIPRIVLSNSFYRVYLKARIQISEVQNYELY